MTVNLESQILKKNSKHALTICTEISVKNFHQMVLVSFLATKTATGLRVVPFPKYR